MNFVHEHSYSLSALRQGKKTACRDWLRKSLTRVANGEWERLHKVHKEKVVVGGPQV